MTYWSIPVSINNTKLRGKSEPKNWMVCIELKQTIVILFIEYDNPW